MSGDHRVCLSGVISQGSSVSKEGNLVWFGAEADRNGCLMAYRRQILSQLLTDGSGYY